MNIAITLLSATSYGSITYLTHLIPALIDLDKTNQYHIFISKENRARCEREQSNFHFHVYRGNSQSSLRRFLWEQLVLPVKLKKHDIDVLFTAKNINSLLACCKTIISIRNMQPLCYKEYTNNLLLTFSSALRSFLTKASIRKADRIIAVSNAVKDHLVHRFSESQERIDVVYNGNPIAGASGVHHHPRRPPFLLTASKFVSYANQLSLVKGYHAALRRNGDLPSLHMAGGVLDKAYYVKVKKYISDKGLEKKIKLLGLLSHEEMIQSYHEADAFLYPSTLEACPHTLIEAMACGLPIGTTNSPPMPEICKDAAIYFHPYDINDIADKIHLISSDHTLRQMLKNKTLHRCRFFDWNKTAGQLVDVFTEVCRDG